MNATLPLTKRVRVAEPSDIPTLVAMGQQFVSVPPYCDHIVLSPAQTAETLRGLLESPDGQVFVSTAGDALTGMIILVRFIHPWSGESVVGELAWWVDPLAKGAPGLALLKAAEQWARSIGAQVMQMIAPSVPVGRLYERKGYQSVEVAYQKRLA